MATRSNIGIKIDSKILSVYCHWDGYPSHNGDILLNHYKTSKKVFTLVSLGDISSLGEEISPPEGMEHSFEKPLEGVTVFYGRDRGEDNTEPRYVTLKKFHQEAYSYYFDDGTWYWSKDGKKYKILTQEDCNE